MKKILIVCSILTLVMSCKKDGSSIGGSSVASLDTEADKAAYAYGLNMSRNVENAKRSPFFEKDSLNNDELIKGFKDYLNDNSGKKLSYVFGQQLAASIENIINSQELGDDFNTDLVVQGLLDNLNKDSLLIPIDSTRVVIGNYEKGLLEIKKEKNLKKTNEYLAKQEKVDGITKTESGLLYEVVSKNDGGEKIKDTDVVEVKYEGSLVDGKVFDGTDKFNDGNPRDMLVSQVVAGFKEGLLLMNVGDKFKFYIPPALGYGENGNPRAGIGPNETLIFDVEIVGRKDAPEQLKTPQPQITPKPSGN